MIKWLKKLLGVDTLETELGSLRTQSEALSKEKDEMQSELTVLRKMKEEDEARRNSKTPWVEIRGEDIDSAKGIRIELDWNDAFIQYLKESGIKGKSDEEIVQKWVAFLYQDIVEKLEATVVEKATASNAEVISDYL